MTHYIIPSNPKMYDARSAFNVLKQVNWVQHNNTSVSIGDIIYIYESQPTQRLILKTRVTKRDVFDHYIDDLKFSEGDNNFGVNGPWFTLELVKNIENKISNHDLNLLGIKGSIQSLRKIDDSIADKIESLINLDDDLSSYSITDGGRIKFLTSRYERNPKNRKLAIEIHGYKCHCCGIDFEEIYGDLGKNFIEIHHIIPLFTINEEVIIDPESDLIPLCSNCHRMIHRRKDKLMTPHELTEIINSNKNHHM